MERIVVRSGDLLPRIANEILESEAIGLDIETVGFAPLPGKLRLVAINTGKIIYVIDLFETGTLGPVLDALRKQKTIVSIHNAKYEQKWSLHLFGLEIWPLFDTYRASAILYNGKKGSDGRAIHHSLFDVEERELGIPSLGRMDLGASDWSGPLTPQQYEYSGNDVEHLLNLRKVLKEKLTRDGLNRIALIEFGVILPEAAVELAGFSLDRESWIQIARHQKSEKDRLYLELIKTLPNPELQGTLPGLLPMWNLDSTEKVLESLKLLGIKNLLDTKEMTLAQHVGKHPVVDKLLGKSVV